MKILNKLTLKNLIVNKKRTITTIFVVTLSSMLLFLVAMAGSVYRNLSYKMVTDTYGAQDVIFNRVNMNQKEIITNDEHVKSYYYVTEIGKAPYRFDEITIYSISDSFNMNLNLNGNLPTNDKEIIVSVEVAKSNKVNIGETLFLKVNEEEKEYTVTGIFPTNYIAGFKNYQNVYTKGQDTNTGFFYVNFDSYKDISNKISTISYKLYGKSEQSSPVDVNTDLIGLYTMYGEGALTQGIIILLLMLFMFIVGFIVLFVIYNSFMISVNERKKSFAIYKSVGASSKQILKSVLFEGLIISIIGIPLGFLLHLGVGYGVMIVLNHLLENVFSFPLTISIYFPFILMALFYIFACIFLACFMPAKRASEATIIDTIHKSTEYSKKGSIFKENKLVTKLFGIEGVISRKNIVRNSRKYNITVFSIILGCILFLTISTFVHFFDFISDTERQEYQNMDISLYVNRKEENGLIKQLKENSNIDDILKIVDMNLVAKFNDEDFAITLENKKVYGSITFLEDDMFDKIAKENNQTGDILIYNWINPYYIEGGEVQLFNKQEITFSLVSFGEEEKIYYEEKGKVISKIPEELLDKYYELFTAYMPRLYMRESSIPKYEDYVSSNYNTVIKTTKYEEIDEIINNFDEKNILAIENYQNPGLSMITTMKTIYAFDFIAYIGLAIIIIITVTSIINTVNTNMELRRSEFAVLRSLGLSKKQFHKMIFFESLMLSLKALFFGLLLYAVILTFIFKAILINSYTVEYITQLIPYSYIIICIVSVFLIVYITMYFVTRKFYQDNIIDAVREEIM